MWDWIIPLIAGLGSSYLGNQAASDAQQNALSANQNSLNQYMGLMDKQYNDYISLLRNEQAKNQISNQGMLWQLLTGGDESKINDYIWNTLSDTTSNTTPFPSVTSNNNNSGGLDLFGPGGLNWKGATEDLGDFFEEAPEKIAHGFDQLGSDLAKGKKQFENNLLDATDKSLEPNPVAAVLGAPEWVVDPVEWALKKNDAPEWVTDPVGKIVSGAKSTIKDIGKKWGFSKKGSSTEDELSLGAKSESGLGGLTQQETILENIIKKDPNGDIVRKNLEAAKANGDMGLQRDILMNAGYDQNLINKLYPEGASDPTATLINLVKRDPNADSIIRKMNTAINNKDTGLQRRILIEAGYDEDLIDKVYPMNTHDVNVRYPENRVEESTPAETQQEIPFTDDEMKQFRAAANYIAESQKAIGNELQGIQTGTLGNIATSKQNDLQNLINTARRQLGGSVSGHTLGQMLDIDKAYASPTLEAKNILSSGLQNWRQGQINTIGQNLFNQSPLNIQQQAAYPMAATVQPDYSTSNWINDIGNLLVTSLGGLSSNSNNNNFLDEYLKAQNTSSYSSLPNSYSRLNFGQYNPNSMNYWNL